MLRTLQIGLIAELTTIQRYSMPTNRVVTKSLVCVEDLLLGEGSVNQDRGGSSVPVNRINADTIPYSSTESIKSKLEDKVAVLDTFSALKAYPTSSKKELYIHLLGSEVARDGGGGLFYLDKTDVTSVENLSGILIPDVPSNGRWKRVDLNNYASDDLGDTDYDIKAIDFGFLVFNSTLSTTRTVLLPSNDVYKGRRLSIIADGIGSNKLSIIHNITIIPITIATLTDNTRIELQYDGTEWRVLSNYLIDNTESFDFNGSFERANSDGSPINWKLPSNHSGEFLVDYTDSKHGNASLKISSVAQGTAQISSADVAVDAGKNVTVSVTYKSSDANIKTVVWLSSYNKAGNLVDTAVILDKGTGNPSQYETVTKVVKAHSTAVHVRVVITAIDPSGTVKVGTVHFDNISVSQKVSSIRHSIVYLTNNQNIISGNPTNTVVAYDTVESDLENLHSNGRFTIPAAVSKVKLTAQALFFSSNIAGEIYSLTLLKNGLEDYVGRPKIFARGLDSSGSGEYINIQLTSPILNVVPGDFFEILPYHVNNSSSSKILDGDTDGSTNWFSIEILE